MNPQRRSFIRKIVYISAVAALLLPLSWLSRPATTTEAGGKLAELRQQYGLSQASLGEIDPTSETIKLAMLGMRGVAANVLWVKANHYKMVEDWTNLSATLEQITKVQPNFSSVWIHQGWNLAYNVSVEFDNYRDRYYWVMRGINFLKEGITYNTGDPRLMWELAWTIGNKIGRADEHLLYRKMFKEDNDFHNADNPRRERRDRDNWLVSREKFLIVVDMVDRQGRSMRAKSPMLYYSDPTMMQFNYCDALQEEGVFGEVAKAAWKRGADDWADYGNRDLPTTYGITIRLADQERHQKRAEQLREELGKLLPKDVDLAEQIRAERIAKLEPEERELLKAPPESLSHEERLSAASLARVLIVTESDVADRVKGKHRAAALRTAHGAMYENRLAQIIDNYREQVNFLYWQMRARFEQSDDGLAARKFVYDAKGAYDEAKFPVAIDLYNQGLAKWRAVIDRNPELLKHTIMVEDLVEIIDEYRKALDQDDAEFPKEFVLEDVLKRFKQLQPESEAPAAEESTGHPSESGSAPAPQSTP